MATIMKIFQNVGTAKVATSAQEAKELHFLGQDDEITMNRARVLYEAKSKCLEKVENYEAPLQGYTPEQILKTEIGWCEPWIFTFENDVVKNLEILSRPDCKSMSQLPD